MAGACVPTALAVGWREMGGEALGGPVLGAVLLAPQIEK